MAPKRQWFAGLVLVLLMGWASAVLASTAFMEPNVCLNGWAGSYGWGPTITFSSAAAGTFAQAASGSGMIVSEPVCTHGIGIWGPKGEDYIQWIDWAPTGSILFMYGVDQPPGDPWRISKVTWTGKIEFNGAVVAEFSETWLWPQLPFVEDGDNGTRLSFNLGNVPFPVYWYCIPGPDPDQYLWQAWGQGVACLDFSYSQTLEVVDLAGPVPLPPTILLLSSGLLGLVGWTRFRKIN
jgi:hypothetical protein